MKVNSYRESEKIVKKTKVSINMSEIIDLYGGRHKPISQKKGLKYDDSCLIFDENGNNDSMGGMQKSYLKLRAKYFRDGKFFVGRLTDFPEVFTDDFSVEKLKEGLVDSAILYYDWNPDKLDIEVEMHEDPELAKTYPE